MPRAFLITSRRYNGNDGEFDEAGREFSPEHGVRLAEYSCNGGHQPTSDGASECASEDSSSECPEELYNLTKLAEVSLAAAAGTLVHPRHYHHHQQQHHHHHHHHGYEPERTRLFFERIESERESLIELKTRRIERDDGLLEAARIVTDIRYGDEFKPNDATLPPTPPSTGPTTPTHDSNNMSNKRHIETETHHRDASALTPSDNTVDQQQQQQELCEEHECPDCGKRYSTSSNLARHRQTHRSLGDKKARRCPHCDKVYVSIPAFSMHVRTHNQGCKCHFCGKCFSRPWLLQGHIRTHTGEKPFKCTICNKAFADKSNLRAHIQTHSNTKPHVCGRCGKAFALKSYLYKHEESSCMRSHHNHQQKQRETSGSPRPLSTTSSSLSSSSSSSSPSNQPTPTSSPTSVIVPPRSFSSIIQHTSSKPERDCATTLKEDDPSRDNNLLSRMVIRTSVISPNPEHIATRFAAEKKVLQQQQQQQQQQQNQNQPFDFNDPTRVSAFSRPQPSMTLNLAIA